ncbi:glycerophosphodiester phosphodiesterase [Bacillaceae bacterium SIJ1]|uniref:glycerophosphodiester phosphodiesterase family protein n=1 Tax=Litoribacterium kuwaitense TaxID=1398745 RepID=UPI0013ED2C10|nr:glycerophosphodiester phosphodiesterase family protein [Litoribacterium kuwaitense]NGP45263.1 glycerophosphodiester phosphodiesterase [Litoribacterium kuwaitense]
MIEQLKHHTSMILAAHRGWKSEYPENTILSFKKAIALGADMLEFDLRRTKDGVVVVVHDKTVDRTTDGSGSVDQFTLNELKQLDAGGWFAKEYEGLKIPSLEEVCEFLKQYPNVLFNVEIKPDPSAKETADDAIAILGEYGYLSRCVFTSFDANILSYIYDEYHLKTQGFPANQMLHFVHGDEGTYSKMWAAGISMDLLTPKLVQEFEERDILAWCYCPDSEQQVYYALGCGVKLMTVNNLTPALEIRRIIRDEG